MLRGRLTPTLGMMAALACAAGSAWALDDARLPQVLPVTKTPALVAQVLDARFDVSFQDGREHAGVQRMIAQIGAEPSVIMTAGDPDNQARVTTCFHPDSLPSAEIIQIVNQHMMAGLSSRYQLDGGTWSAANNTPATLRWSFVPDGLSIPSGVGEAVGNSELFSRMDSLFGGNRNLWVQQFESVFNRWSALTGLSYVRVQNGTNPWDDGAAWGSTGAPTRGDVRIGMKNIDGTNGILAYNSFPTGGDMVIDRAESWGSSSNNYRFLRNTIAHEHGHGIGLRHVCPGNSTKLMEPALATAFDGPQQDDVRGAHLRYGDVYEPNGNPSATPPLQTDLGTLAAPSTITLGAIPSPNIVDSAVASIQEGDNDWYRFELTQPRLLNLTLTPIGSNYLDGPQNQACTSSNITNSLAQGDLQFLVYVASPTTANLIMTRSEQAVGLAESYGSLLLPAGVSWIRVNELGTTPQTQLYTLQVAVQGTDLTPVASSNLADRVQLNFRNIPSATEYRVWRNTNNSTAGATTIATITPPATGLTVTFDDLTAVPGQQYFYFVLAAQSDVSGLRFYNTTGNGAAGLRIVTNLPPNADAGTDITAYDDENAGTAPVTLSGALSTDTDGTIVQYRWNLGATVLGQSASPTLNVNLPIGISNITLTVTDDDNATDTDTVVVTVIDGCGDVDFNNDGVFPDDSDLADFLAVLGGSPCAACDSVDFNNDGVFPDDSDVVALLDRLGGGPCPR